MKPTLLFKYLFGYIVFAIIGFLIVCTFSQTRTYQVRRQEEATSLYRESNLVASRYAANYWTDTLALEDFQEQIEIIATYTNSEVWIIDGNGTVLLNTTDPDLNETKIKGFQISDFGNSYYRVSNFYDSFSKDYLSVYSPITIQYKVRGYVLIHKNMSYVLENSNHYLHITFHSGILFFLTSLLLVLFFIFFIYRPLRALVLASERYAKQDFSKPASLKGSDEITYVGNTLDYMAHELHTLEDEQRKFVSNVSHDFRSPLTSIKGYVEAMLDGTIPIEMQEKYLNIILFETERLNKLTKGLLDLNQFGKRGIRLDLAEFDINRMIRTTVLTFEGTCTKKNLSFDLVLVGNELLVKGDMTKIQQVLYNLIDNATKFSHSGTAIKIETRIKNEKAFISVKDHGIGIPADSIKKIWDRFYKTDLSRGKDKRGTGLGLSIVKEIITAHGEHINVISTEDVGTEFIFTLPLGTKELE